MNAIIGAFTDQDLAAAILVLRKHGETVTREGPRVFVNGEPTARRDVIQYAADLEAIERGQVWRVHGRKRALEA